MKQVLLAGNAITADILYSYLKHDPRFEVIGITVDDEYLESGAIEGIRSVGVSQLTTVYSPEDVAIIMAMGYDDLNRKRESMFFRLKEMGYSIETYVHPDACVYSEHPLGEGCVVLPHAVVEPHVRIGGNTMIWCNVTLAHHSKVAEHCWVASGAVVSGQANILRNSFIGVNATIVNEVTVGEFNIIGAAAMISKDTKASTVYLARSAELFRYPSDDYIKFFGV